MGVGGGEGGCWGAPCVFFPPSETIASMTSHAFNIGHVGRGESGSYETRNTRYLQPSTPANPALTPLGLRVRHGLLLRLGRFTCVSTGPGPPGERPWLGIWWPVKGGRRALALRFFVAFKALRVGAVQRALALRKNSSPLATPLMGVVITRGVLRLGCRGSKGVWNCSAVQCCERNLDDQPSYFTPSTPP